MNIQEIIGNKSETSLVTTSNFTTETEDNYYESDSFAHQNGRFKSDFKQNNDKPIGSGGYGHVYKVVNKFDDEEYAVKKIIIKNQKSQDKKYLREIKLWAKLKNEFIVQFKSAWIESIVESNDDKDIYIGDNPKILYIQMELCAFTLKDAIKKIGTELNQSKENGVTIIGAYIATQLFGEIVEGVNYLHKQLTPIMHRDLKPSNILLSINQLNGYFTKLTDFGCAKQLKNEFTHNKNDFNLIDYHTKAGTKRYMSPEVINGNKYDMSADIYSLGVILCDLFYMDENQLLQNKDNLKLQNKFDYSRVISLINKLLHEWISMRPKCEEILRNRQKWETDFEEIKLNYHLENICYYNWDYNFYNRNNSLNLSTIILMMKFQFEVEKQYKLINSKGIDNRLEREYSGIRDVSGADVISVNTNISPLEESKKQFLPLILHSLSIHYSLDELNSFVEHKLEEKMSTKWHCFSTSSPIALFPKIINWYDCKYFFTFFFNSARKQSVIMILLINTINLKCEDFESEKCIRFENTMNTEMSEKSVKLAMNEINKNLSIEVLQENICLYMKELCKDYEWKCYIAKNELFLAYYDVLDTAFKIKFMNAFRVNHYCIIITSSTFLSTTFQNIQKNYPKIWRNIPVKDKQIIQSSISPDIGFFKSIHLKIVKTINDRKCFVHIEHKFKDMFHMGARNCVSNYCFSEFDIKTCEIKELTEYQTNSKYSPQEYMIRKNTIYDEIRYIIEKLVQDIAQTNFFNCNKESLLTAIKSARKLSEYEMTGPLIYTGKLKFFLNCLRGNDIIYDNIDFENRYELIYETLITLFEFVRNGLDRHKHYMIGLNCNPIFIELLNHSSDDICFYSVRTLLAIIDCCEKCRDNTLENGIINPLLALIKPNKSLTFLTIISSTIGKICSDTYALPPNHIIKQVLSSVANLLDHSDNSIIDISLSTVKSLYRANNCGLNFASVLVDCKITPKLISLLNFENSTILSLVLFILKQISISNKDSSNCVIFNNSVLTQFNTLLKHKDIDIRWKAVHVLKSCLLYENDEKIQLIIDTQLMLTIINIMNSADDFTLYRNSFDFIHKIVKIATEKQLIDICSDSFVRAFTNLLVIHDNFNEYIVSNTLNVITNIKGKSQLIGEKFDNYIEMNGNLETIEMLKRKEIPDISREEK